MMDDRPLERDLESLARAVAFPHTPDLAAGFRRRLEATRPQPQLAPPWALAGVGLAVALLVAAAVVASVAPAREAVADLFDRITIFETTRSPDELAELPREIEGTPLPVEEVREMIELPLLVPTYPDGLVLERALFQDFHRVKVAVLFFRHPDGTEFALFQSSGGVSKGLPAGAQPAEEVQELGPIAHWLQGMRIVLYQDPEGSLIEESVRVTDANTLLWMRDGRTFRLEGPLDRDEAIRIAQSLR